MLVDLELTEYQTVLQTDDRLLLFSDGVPDATNRRDEAYGYERLRTSCAHFQSYTAETLVDALVADIDQWTGRAEAFDDLTLLVVEVGDSQALQTKERYDR